MVPNYLAFVWIGVVICVCWLWWKWPIVKERLIGSQKNYHLLPDGSVYMTVGRLNGENRKKGWPMRTIELRQGFWRGQSKMYSENWELSKVMYGWMGYDDKIGVSLRDKLGITIQAALQMSYRYRSFQQLLDDLERTKTDLRNSQGHCEEFRKRCTQQAERISELEKQARYIWAGVEATLQIIENDRQRYRSEPAKRIRFCLGFIQEYGYMEIADQSDPQMVQSWVKAFQEAL